MPKVIGIGPHFYSALKQKGLDKDFQPKVFLKSFLGVIPENKSIRIPDEADYTLAEVEVAVKIKNTCRNYSAQQVAKYDCIGGYAVCGDLTAVGDNVSGEGKLYDTFTPCSPFSLDAPTVHTTLEARLNGKLMQQASLSDMGMNINECVAYISQILTLEPGDIVLTGTPAGAFQISHGDTIAFSGTALGNVTYRVD